MAILFEKPFSDYVAFLQANRGDIVALIGQTDIVAYFPSLPSPMAASLVAFGDALRQENVSISCLLAPGCSEAEENILRAALSKTGCQNDVTRYAEINRRTANCVLGMYTSLSLDIDAQGRFKQNVETEPSTVMAAKMLLMPNSPDRANDLLAALSLIISSMQDDVRKNPGILRDDKVPPEAFISALESLKRDFDRDRADLARTPSPDEKKPPRPPGRRRPGKDPTPPGKT